MIEMTPEIKKNLLDLGRDALDRTDPNQMLIKLFNNSNEIMKRLGKRELPQCNVTYTYFNGVSNKYSPELFSWATGLICMRYTLFLLKQKAIEGHCNTHNKKTGVPCADGKIFHENLFNEAKKDFEKILNHDYEKEIKNDQENFNNKKKKLVLIIRTYKNKKIKDFIERILKNDTMELIDKIIILVNYEAETDYYTQTLLSTCNFKIFNKLKIIHIKPWGLASGALNIGLKEAFEMGPDHILIISPEVEINNDQIKKMSDVLTQKKNMLVVGYALKGGHDLSNASNALKTPWNTCAMWNTDLFIKNVGSFNIVCDCPIYLGEKNGISLHGMEDALAISLANRTDSSLEIGLIKEPLNWGVDPARITQHIEKMKRKPLVYERYQEIFGKFATLDISLL